MSALQYPWSNKKKDDRCKKHTGKCENLNSFIIS